MKNIKRLLVLGLALVMCFSAMSISAFAEGFTTSVTVDTRYNETGDKLYVSIHTTELAGAFKAKLSFSENVSFVPGDSKFNEGPVEDDMYNLTTNELTFVLLANDISVGATYWADLCFNVADRGNISFSVSGIEVCDVNENLATNSIKVDDINITVAEFLNTLGAQYRETTPALRFGSRIDRKAETIDGVLRSVITIKDENDEEKRYFAVKCGHLLAYSNNLEKDKSDLTATLTNISGTAMNIASDEVVNAPASKVYKNTEECIIFTVAVVYNTSTEGQDKPISARPYVIYRSENGKDFTLVLGEVIENSWNNVESVYNKNLVDNKLYE